MNVIDDILGFKSNVVIADCISAEGQFSTGTGSNLWFEATMACEDYVKIKDIDSDKLSIIGNVSGQNFRIEKAMLCGCRGNLGNLVHVSFLPDTVTISNGFIEKQTQIKQLFFDMPELNWFYNSKVPLSISPSNYELPEIESLPITTVDGENAKLTVTRGYNRKFDHKGNYFINSNLVYIVFEQPASISEAIFEIAKVRMFFTLLADDFVYLPNFIRFFTDDWQDMKTLWINDARIKLPSKKKLPFSCEVRLFE